MNRFVDLEIELLQIAEDQSDAPISFAYRSDRSKPPVLATVPRGLGRISIGEPSGTPLRVEIESITSPGRVVVLGDRELHLQFLRATNPLCRGPLLVFEGGAAVPCFSGERGFWQRLTRAKEKALVPVYLMGTGDQATRSREIEAGLNVALNLLKGGLAPGREDAAYLE